MLMNDSNIRLRWCRILPLLALLLLALPAGAKEGYKFFLQIDGNTDTAILLGHYHAHNLWVFDTAYNNGKGSFLFKGEREMHPGLYFFDNNNGKRVDFVVYGEKCNFRFHTSQADWKMNMEVKGSPQNEIFFNYGRASEILFREMEEAQRELDSATFRSQFLPRQLHRIDSLRMYYINHYPQAMLSKMMLATKDVEVPRNHPDGSPMSREERSMWFMQHYFDNVPLDDNFIIRTPKDVFYRRVMEYVDNHMKGWPPDMICPLLDTLIDRSEPAPEVFKWLVHTLTEKYLQSKVMVYDEVYVHLVKRYYETGKAFWMSPTGIDKEVERANRWEHLLVGKVAPELILFDTLHRAASLHRMPGRYTLLLFWSPTCGHCREVIPAVYKVYERYADSLQISAFSILSEPDDITLGKWKQFLRDHHMTHPRWINLNGAEANVDWREVYDIQSTPQIYFIDNQDHTFMAKKLNADILEMLCKSLTNNK